MQVCVVVGSSPGFVRVDASHEPFLDAEWELEIQEVSVLWRDEA